MQDTDIDVEIQEQPADSDATVAFARSVLHHGASPPRAVSRGRAVACSFRGRGRIIPAVLFTALFAGLFALTFFQPGSAVLRVLLQVLWGGFALFTSLLFVWGGLRLARWCRDGLVAQADVIEVRMIKDQVDGEPRARGRRVVHHPKLGDFRDEFAVGGSWVASIAEGATLDVLVAPHQAKSWLTLGLHEL